MCVHSDVGTKADGYSVPRARSNVCAAPCCLLIHTALLSLLQGLFVASSVRLATRTPGAWYHEPAKVDKEIRA